MRAALPPPRPLSTAGKFTGITEPSQSGPLRAWRLINKAIHQHTTSGRPGAASLRRQINAKSGPLNRVRLPRRCGRRWRRSPRHSFRGRLTESRRSPLDIHITRREPDVLQLWRILYLMPSGGAFSFSHNNVPKPCDTAAASATGSDLARGWPRPPSAARQTRSGGPAAD